MLKLFIKCPLSSLKIININSNHSTSWSVIRYFKIQKGEGSRHPPPPPIRKFGPIVNKFIHLVLTSPIIKTNQFHNYKQLESLISLSFALCFLSDFSSQQSHCSVQKKELLLRKGSSHYQTLFLYTVPQIISNNSINLTKFYLLAFATRYYLTLFERGGQQHF